MKIIKPKTLGILHKAYGFQHQDYCVIAPVVFFRLTPEDAGQTPLQTHLQNTMEKASENTSDSPNLLHSPHSPYNSAHSPAHNATMAQSAPAERHLPDILLENEQWPLIQDALGASLFDLVMPKPQCEYLLAGTAYPPTSNSISESGAESHEKIGKGKRSEARAANESKSALEPASDSQTTAQKFRASVSLYQASGELIHHKSVNVFGERQWQKQLLGYGATQAKPASSTPLDLAHAFGGEGLMENPEGMGFYPNKKQEALLLAPIESPEQPVTLIRQKPESVGFGPLPITHPSREKHNGDYTTQKWLEEHFPNLAPDTDFALFQSARSDQQFAQGLQGGESYQLMNLHPEHPCLQGTLPHIRPRAFVVKKGDADNVSVNDNADLPLDSVPLTLDTLWFFPNQQIGALIYRGQVPCSDPDALDISHVLLAYEHATDAPKPLTHYQHVLASRLDPEMEALVANDDSQLCPQKTQEQLAQEQAEVEQEAQALWEKQKAQQEAVLEEIKTANNGTLPAGFEKVAPPKKPDVLVSSAAIARGDFNLTALKAEADKQVAQAKAQEAALKQTQAQQQAQINALMKQENTPRAQAVSLHALMQSLAKNAENANSATKNDRSSNGLLSNDLPFNGLPPNGPSGNTLSDDDLAKLKVLEIEANRYKSAPLGDWPETAQSKEKRAVFLTALANNEPLNARDWSGCDLSDLALSGRDLSGCSFENCNIAHSQFTHCHLAKSSFVGARISDCDFSFAELSQSNFSSVVGAQNRFCQANLALSFWMKSMLVLSQFTGANLRQSQWMEAGLTHSQFDDSNLSQACFVQAQLTDCDFNRCNADMLVLLQCVANISRWQQVEFERCAFLECELTLSQWAGAMLTKCQFSAGTTLTSSLWAQARLKECGLRRVDAANMQANEAIFHQCDLGDSHFTQGRFNKTEFSQSVLSDSNLSESRLNNANFYRALMRKTQLQDCDLHQANFYQADALLANTVRSEYQHAQNVPALTQKRWSNAHA